MQIIYFPYLHMGEVDEINFGETKVWNFQKKAEEYIPDEETRRHIAKIIHSNIYYNEPIKDVGILSIGNTDFREFNQEEIRTANEVRLILFLSFLSKNNTIKRGGNAGWVLGTSENFEFIFQNFDVNSDHIAENSGWIVPITAGGYRIGEKKFHAPPHVLRFWRLSLDGLLIKNLLKLKKRGGKRLYERILGATDLFFESYYNNPSVSRNARVLLQVASFETLLNLDEHQGRKDFKDKVEKYCNLRNEKLYAHHYETRNGKRKERRSKKAIWADTYYTLRNHIIHGSGVVFTDFDYKGVQRHIDIAVIFFVLLIKKLLNEKFPEKKIFYDEVRWGSTDDSDRVYTGFIYDDNDLTRLISQEINRKRVRISP